MNKFQIYTLIISGLILTIHSFFPPRVLEDDIRESAGRAFIVSDSFYVQWVNEPGSGGMVKYLDQRKKVIDWTRFITESCGIVGFSLCCFGVASLANGKMEEVVITDKD